MRLQQVLVSDFPFTVSPPHDLPQHTHTQMSLTIANNSVIQVLAVLILNSQFLG